MQNHENVELKLGVMYICMYEEIKKSSCIYPSDKYLNKNKIISFEEKPPANTTI